MGKLRHRTSLTVYKFSCPFVDTRYLVCASGPDRDPLVSLHHLIDLHMALASQDIQEISEDKVSSRTLGKNASRIKYQGWRDSPVVRKLVLTWG